MEEESLDILNYWPSTVVDLIFQHLSGKEILSSTLVSRSWNNFLSQNSLTAWKDVTIQPIISDDFSYLVNSKRRFQNLIAVNISAILPAFLEIVKKPGRKWKSISIFRQTFIDESQMLDILKASAKTIQKLELHTITKLQSTEDELTAPVSYPRLKQLRIFYHFLDDSPTWLNKFITDTPNLETIHITNGCDINIRNIILGSKNLKKLSIAGRFQDCDFFRELSKNLPSRLEEFEFNDILTSSESDENLSYFNNFFKSQSKTLRKFETDALLELDEFETAFKMLKLETLIIKSFHYNRDLIDDYLDNLRRSEISPANLKVFNVQVMDQKLLELLALHAINLEKLRADELTIIDASNLTWFPKLEIFQVFYLCQEIDDAINAKPAAARSRLEQLIFNGVINRSIADHLSHEEIARELLGAFEEG